MLKVLYCAEESLPEKTIIEYGLPLSIRWGMPTSQQYWSTGHPEYSLIEFGVEKDSGLLRSITLVSPHKVVRNSDLSFPTDLPTETGMPVCQICNSDFTISDDRYVEESYDFEIHLYEEDKVCVITCPLDSLSSWVVNGRVKLGLDQTRRLCVLVIEQLSQDEKGHLVSTIDMVIEQRLNDGQACGIK
jgi:hypothetical protein